MTSTSRQLTSNPGQLSFEQFSRVTGNGIFVSASSRSSSNLCFSEILAPFSEALFISQGGLESSRGVAPSPRVQPCPGGARVESSPAGLESRRGPWQGGAAPPEYRKWRPEGWRCSSAQWRTQDRDRTGQGGQGVEVEDRRVQGRTGGPVWCWLHHLATSYSLAGRHSHNG